MAGMKLSKMSAWVLNMHEMGPGGQFDFKLFNKLSKAQYTIVSRYCILTLNYESNSEVRCPKLCTCMS